MRERGRCSSTFLGPPSRCWTVPDTRYPTSSPGSFALWSPNGSTGSMSTPLREFWSAKGQTFRGVRGCRIWLAHHPERVREPSEPGEDGDEESDLKGKRACVGVDADDLRLDVRRLPGQLFLELGIGHELCVVFERGRYLFLLSGVEHRAVVG